MSNTNHTGRGNYRYAEIEEILAMYGNGVEPEEIAQELNLSTKSVFAIIGNAEHSIVAHEMEKDSIV